jgi:N-acetylmuramoyl-L-alanine amidase
MEHLNRIELKGRVGTVRTNEVSGTKVANFSLVSELLYKTREGAPTAETTWFNVAAWSNKDMPDLDRIEKGMALYVSGRMAEQKAVTVVIDSGHGGIDPGKIAADGTLEKNINLAIALDLRDMLTVCGVPVSMTRQTDISIHDADCDTVRSKKVSDMHNRLKLYEQADTVIAIHQNHYGASKYRGAQVFYSANHPSGQVLAESVQTSFAALLQRDNTREIKKATDGIFLLSHTTKPAVLVECGFLSNPDERELLKSPTYRQQVALAIAAGYWNYVSQE